MLHEQRFSFLASWEMALAVSCVYGRSLLYGKLTNVINTTFDGAAEDTLACRVHLHAVPAQQAQIRRQKHACFLLF